MGDPRAEFGPDDFPWVHRDDFEQHPGFKAAPTDYAALARSYHDDGYVVLPQVVPPELCQAVVRALDPVFAKRPVGRLTDAWWVVEPVREVAILPQVLDVLAFLYDRRPIPFQTLNFRVGTQQHAHSDVIHFSSLPPKFMCGVWVALEDVEGDQGPLFYHPGSHVLPELAPAELGRTPADFHYPDYEAHMEALMRERGAEPVRLNARQGDVLIWSSNLVHGGTEIERVASTRWSQVTHFMFEDCVFYLPMMSDLPQAELYIKHPMLDIATRQPARHTINGEPVRYVHLAHKRSLVVRDGDAVPLRLRVPSAARSVARHAVWRGRPLAARLLRRPLYR